MKFFGIRKRSWKKILTVGVSLLLIVAAVGVPLALFGKDTKTIGAMKFSLGNLDAQGKHVDSDTSIYTKEAFPCQGLRIVPDFEARGEFDVYYYDDNEKFLGVSAGLIDVFEEDYPVATRCRVVYRPAKPDDVKTSEWSIGFFEVAKYAKQLTITVDKDQPEYVSSADLFVPMEGTGAFTELDVSEIVADPGYSSSQLVTVDEKYDYYRIYVRTTSTISNSAVVAFGDDESKAIYVDEDGKIKDGFAYTFDANAMIANSWYSVLVEVPEGATVLRVMGPADAEFRIYGVNVK